MLSLRLDTLITLLMAALVALAVVLSCAGDEATCESCDDHVASADQAQDDCARAAESAPDGCAERCPGEDDEGHCADDCAFCNCCGAPAPVTLAAVPLMLELPSELVEQPCSLDPPMSRARGVPFGIFKPPRLRG